MQRLPELPGGSGSESSEMLAVVTGTGSPRAYHWRASLHYVIIFPRTVMCGLAERMNSVPLGNLVQGPAGAGTAAG